MMQNVHLAPENNEDDLYSGYNDYNPMFDTEDLENDVAFQQAARTSHGRRPSVTAKIPGTSSPRPLATGFGSKATLTSSMGRPMTGTIQDGVSRPMTAVQAAGYTKAAVRGSSFDPLGQARGPASPLEKKTSDSLEEKMRQLEKKVNELVEESCVANSCGDLKLALEKAKEAGRQERELLRQREQITPPESINLDLTYTVLLNLASQYVANEMYAEALTTYQVIVKNKMFSNGGILKVNIGNIYLKQRNYSKAIKFYRMALDQITSSHKQMRIKIMENIGVAFIKTGQYVDAISSFEEIMSISPNLKAGFNLILCYFAIGNGEQMKKAFKNLIEVPLEVDYEDKYISLNALETLKMFEKKDSRVKSAAATNLSFLYYLGNELEQATNYADLAVNSDRYNPAALTNKGNTVFANGDCEKAAEFYKEALRNDSLCTEALYNLGLAYKKLNRIDEALDCFLKLHAILPNSAQVLYQLASIYQIMEDPNQAIEWLLQLISVVPTDPHVLSKLGNLYDIEGDKSQAFHYYCESYRYFPSNIEVIEWLGAYYIDTQFCEKAIEYFERAALILPTQVKWQLMVASCYRRSGNYQKALEKYKVIHRKFPENVECLRFLVRLCTDMGLKEVQEYITKLKKAEKLKEIREQRIKSGREGSARSRKEGSGDSGGTKGERLSAKLKALPGTSEPYESSSSKEIDASYADPLGPQPERPKTAARKRTEEDDFADEELGEDLLPE
ncbi:intraflagellar transport protein 88 homolog isoform X4 [Vidua chalybeata]|uniref:intraflagellar transport protein 88 homolog isoform X4 n=1 Tax=Vidua chalybeata TaxID=81927 RepID=UPI0023A8DA76|nr:intraflagellar transport protein 88 homolog isoform X4 [Vidua chalybeata]